MSTKTVVNQAAATTAVPSTKRPSLGANIRTIGHALINVPIELVGATAEVAADLSGATSFVVRETLPTVKAVTEATGRFTVGAFNSEKTEAEVNVIYSNVSFASLRASAVAGSVGAGQRSVLATAKFLNEE